MTDRFAEECHGYDIDGYPIADLSDCPPAIAAKLARCNEIARVQREATNNDYDRPDKLALTCYQDRAIMSSIFRRHNREGMLPRDCSPTEPTPFYSAYYLNLNA